MMEPSAQITSLITTLSAQPAAAAAMQLMLQRQAEFPSPLQAQLTGIALDPASRAAADANLDGIWSDETRRQDVLDAGGTGREVIIGSGVHAAVYAAVRVRNGHPRPIVLERSARAGGTFAMTSRPVFRLNSRNRTGNGGLAGDQGAALNYLPGGLIQAANVSMAEYQDNTDMALPIRIALAQFADVVTGATVRAVRELNVGYGATIDIDGRAPLTAGRVIDARGLGDPLDERLANGTTIVTFPQFMQRMAGMWPLRGLRRVAVIGGGDSAKCAVEALLGIAPQPPMAAAALDQVDRIDWYAPSLPGDCTGWQQGIRGRYQAIGRYLRPDASGARRLIVVNRRATPVALPDGALIDGRSYDLAVLCTGYRETDITGLEDSVFTEYDYPAGNVVARQHLYDLPAFRVGPHAKLPITARERADGLADDTEIAVAMFRTTHKTAALAATLPALT